jgi:hypothetical protein
MHAAAIRGDTVEAVAVGECPDRRREVRVAPLEPVGDVIEARDRLCDRRRRIAGCVGGALQRPPSG